MAEITFLGKKFSSEKVRNRYADRHELYLLNESKRGGVGETLTLVEKQEVKKYAEKSRQELKNYDTEKIKKIEEEVSRRKTQRRTHSRT